MVLSGLKFHGASRYGASSREQITASNRSRNFYVSPASQAEYALTELTYVPSGSNYYLDVCPGGDGVAHAAHQVGGNGGCRRRDDQGALHLPVVGAVSGEAPAARRCGQGRQLSDHALPGLLRQQRLRAGHLIGPVEVAGGEDDGAAGGRLIGNGVGLGGNHGPSGPCPSTRRTATGTLTGRCT